MKANGNLTEWNLTTTLALPGTEPGLQRGGVFTAIAVDEWGDMAVAHFRVNQ